MPDAVPDLAARVLRRRDAPHAPDWADRWGGRQLIGVSLTVASR